MIGFYGIAILLLFSPSVYCPFRAGYDGNSMPPSYQESQASVSSAGYDGNSTPQGYDQPRAAQGYDQPRAAQGYDQPRAAQPNDAPPSYVESELSNVFNRGVALAQGPTRSNVINIAGGVVQLSDLLHQSASGNPTQQTNPQQTNHFRVMDTETGEWKPLVQDPNLASPDPGTQRVYVNGKMRDVANGTTLKIGGKGRKRYEVKVGDGTSNPSMLSIATQSSKPLDETAKNTLMPKLTKEMKILEKAPDVLHSTITANKKIKTMMRGLLTKAPEKLTEWNADAMDVLSSVTDGYIVTMIVREIESIPKSLEDTKSSDAQDILYLMGAPSLETILNIYLGRRDAANEDEEKRRDILTNVLDPLTYKEAKGIIEKGKDYVAEAKVRLNTLFYQIEIRQMIIRAKKSNDPKDLSDLAIHITKFIKAFNLTEPYRIVVRLLAKLKQRKNDVSVPTTIQRLIDGLNKNITKYIRLNSQQFPFARERRQTTSHSRQRSRSSSRSRSGSRSESRSESRSGSRSESRSDSRSESRSESQEGFQASKY